MTSTEFCTVAIQLIWLLVLSQIQCTSTTIVNTSESPDGENTFYNNEIVLRKQLLQNYNVHVLPAHHKDSPVQVDIRLTLVSIRELNERSERLTVETFVQLMWNDSRLSWNSEEYGGIKSVRFPDHMIWQPDIKLQNSARASEMDPWGDVYTLVSHKGNVRWAPPATFHSICNVDLKLYPYDVQSCHLLFGSWTLDGYHVDIRLYNNESKIELSDTYNENNEWEITESRSTKKTRYYPCCEEPYPEVNYELRLRRRAPYYKFTTLYPTLAAVVLTLATFWLPPNATERVTVGIISLIIFVILLIHLSWKLPPTGKCVPMIVWFCGNSVIITIASIIVSLITINLSRTRHIGPGPQWLKAILNSWAGRILCVHATVVIHNNKRKESAHLEFELDDARFRPNDLAKERYFAQDWINCLKIFDRITFLVFIVAFSLVLGSSFNN